VMKIIKDSDFLMGWDVLYLSCAWATVFQSPKFVIQWYSLYHNVYEPILVYAESQGSLTGLITLANRKDGGPIMAAGRTDAHYQVWVSEEKNKESFIREALLLLRKKFPKEEILLENLPPDAPIEWLESDPNWTDCCTIKPITRPLIELNEDTINQLLKKQQFRQNRNRLKRQGDPQLVNVTDEKQFESILDELATDYDFRQGAIYNRTPFKSNPLKKDFFKILFREKLLIVTVLTLNDEIIASLISIMGLNGYVHGAGINSQSPHYAKLSPGFLNMILFAEELYKGGFKVLDLTTGGQSYKSRLASTSDFVYTFSFSPRTNKLLTRKSMLRIEEYLKKGLTQVNINPKELREQINRKRILSKEKLGLIRKQGLSAFSNFSVRGRNVRQLYEIGSDNNPESGKIAGSINENAVRDLMNFEPEGLTTQWEFLQDSLRRVERGEIPYTWMHNEQLLACIWLKSSAGEEEKENSGPVNILQGLYIRNHLRAELGNFLASVKAVASISHPDRKIYFAEGGALKIEYRNLNRVYL